MIENLLDFPEQRVGVFVSAGTDSTILLYLILKENITAKKDITLFCIPKHDGAADYVHGCVNAVCEKLGVAVPPLFFVGNPDWDHTFIVQRAWGEVADRKIVDKIFLADNVPPPLNLPGLQPRRGRSTHPMAVQPFFDMTKDQIIKLYFDYGIEDILKLTHTCTETRVGACWKCWQCSERMWAFAELGLQDPLRPIT